MRLGNRPQKKKCAHRQAGEFFFGLFCAHHTAAQHHTLARSASFRRNHTPNLHAGRMPSARGWLARSGTVWVARYALIAHHSPTDPALTHRKWADLAVFWGVSLADRHNHPPTMRPVHPAPPYAAKIGVLRHSKGTPSQIASVAHLMSIGRSVAFLCMLCWWCHAMFMCPCYMSMCHDMKHRATFITLLTSITTLSPYTPHPLYTPFRLIDD